MSIEKNKKLLETQKLFDTLDLFTPVVAKDFRKPTNLDIKTNRSFDLWDIPSLEACSKNSEKLGYGLKHLIRDINYFVNYLPPSEINRIVKVIIWLLCEAMKNYGFVYLTDFGSFRAYDRITPVRYNLHTGKSYSTRRMKLSRKIEFKPNGFLLGLITPRSIRYSAVLTVRQRLATWPGLFSSFVTNKKQQLRGKYLVQNAFTRDWVSLGYSPEYAIMLALGEIKDETRSSI